MNEYLVKYLRWVGFYISKLAVVMTYGSTFITLDDINGNFGVCSWPPLGKDCSCRATPVACLTLSDDNRTFARNIPKL